MKPWATIDDVTKEEWVALDFELEKYDKSGKPYYLPECKLLTFVLWEIHQNAMNFNKVPNFIRNGFQFQKLATLCNAQLELILFPTQKSNIVEDCRLMRGATGLGMHECKKLLNKFGNLVDAVDYVRKHSDEPQYEGLTEARFDVLNKDGSVIFTCKTTEEYKKAGYNHWEYHIRAVSSVGRYAQLH